MEMLDMLVEMKKNLDIEIAQEKALNDMYSKHLAQTRKEMTEEIETGLKRIYKYAMKLGSENWPVAYTDLNIADMNKTVSPDRFDCRKIDFTYENSGLYIRQFSKYDGWHLSAEVLFENGEWTKPDYCDKFYEHKDMLFDLYEQWIVNMFFEKYKEKIEGISLTREVLLRQIKNLERIE